MTTDPLLASLHAPEASLSAQSSPIVYTPPSESSALSNTAPPERRPSPLSLSQPSKSAERESSSPVKAYAEAAFDSDLDSDDQADDMPERPTMHRPTDGRSEQPLLKEERGRPSYDSPSGSARPTFATRRSTFRSRSPDLAAQTATRTKYTYAAFFLGLSLVSFVIQTETAVYIQKDLGWNKAYCMLSVLLLSPLPPPSTLPRLTSPQMAHPRLLVTTVACHPPLSTYPKA